MRLGPDGRALALAGLACGCLVACGPSPKDEAESALGAYFAAVQSDDGASIAAHLADCAGGGQPAEAAACAATVAGQVADVAAQRQAGEYRFDDPWGLGLARAFVLGRGGYWTVESAAPDGDSLVVRLLLRTQYRPQETRTLPVDAVVEYLGRPLGHVERVPRHGAPPGGLRWQLDELEVEARLRRAPGADAEGQWLVESVRALPETAAFSQVTWRPQ